MVGSDSTKWLRGKAFSKVWRGHYDSARAAGKSNASADSHAIKKMMARGQVRPDDRFVVVGPRDGSRWTKAVAAIAAANAVGGTAKGNRREAALKAWVTRRARGGR
jgi:hypothetical protein